MRIVVLYAIILLQALTVWGDTDNPTDGEWRLRRDSDGIQVYTRKVAGSAIEAVKAEADIAAPLARVQALLLDIDRRMEWDGMCAEVKTLGKPPATADHAVLLYDMPWPVSDRDVVLRMEHRVHDSGVMIRNTAVTGFAPTNPDAVRIVQAELSWHLEALSAHRTRLVTTAFLDPNGPIPAWLLNSLSVNQPFEMVEKLRKLTANP